jgi:hypothetical protein
VPYEKIISIRTLYKTSLENCREYFIYTDYHWRKIYRKYFFPRVVYFILAGILFVWQLAMIKVYEENVEKRKKEYIEGLKWLAVPILIVLSDMYLDLAYSY